MNTKIITYCKQHKYYIAAGLFLLLAMVLLYVLVSNTHCEHDDWYRRYPFFLGGRAESIWDVFRAAWTHFHIDNARLVCAVWEFFFCSYLDSKEPYNIANSIVFAIFVLCCVYMIGRGEKIGDKQKYYWWCIALFVPLFYFLCPSPGETLCWMCGSVDYLWMTTASMIFLCMYITQKDKMDIPLWVQFCIFVLSIYLGISNNFAVIGIGGALFVYYLFHIKEFKGINAWMVVGFAIGAMIVTFGPGNWARLGWKDEYQQVSIFTSQFDHSGGMSIGGIINGLRSFFSTYKATWLMFISLLALWIKRRKEFMPFVRDNQLLLLSWFWSAVAFSFVLEADIRGLFFTESIALLMTIKIVLNYFYNPKVLWGVILLLVIGVGIDYPRAYKEIRKQYALNEELMQQMVENEGEICWDDVMPNHRFAMYVGYNYPFRYIGQEVKYGWKLVKHPRIYCEVMPDDRICTEANAISGYAYRYGEDIVIKVPKSEQATEVMRCEIDYIIPHSFVRDVAARVGIYHYNHSTTRAFSQPTCENEEYKWYHIKKWSVDGISVTNIRVSTEE